MERQCGHGKAPEHARLCGGVPGLFVCLFDLGYVEVEVLIDIGCIAGIECISFWGRGVGKESDI